MTRFIRGLIILIKYTDDGHCLAAEHDAIYVHIAYDAISETDKVDLMALGFSESEHGTIIFYL